MICQQSTSISTLDFAHLDSDSEAAAAHRKNANSSFADTLARYATPPFSPWPQVMPLHDDTRSTDSSITTRPADQRRERRQRSRG